MGFVFLKLNEQNKKIFVFECLIILFFQHFGAEDLPDLDGATTRLSSILYSKCL